MENNHYDIAVIGGGLAGLAVSTLLARDGYSVVLFEKEHYPFHKVCGEYISMESAPFLKKLGVDPVAMQLPVINELLLTAPNGQSFTTSLAQGGFGMSRYALDQQLAAEARRAGVHLVEGAKVQKVEQDEGFEMEVDTTGGVRFFTAKVCCAATGKRSNLDIKWRRRFLEEEPRKKTENFIAVKYHLQGNWKENRIQLHNFYNGYCGLSKVEGERYCCCYMTTAENLKNAGNHIGVMEKNLLSENPHLGKIFREMKVYEDFPVTISQISFAAKSQVENGVLMLGDAAGMITPLCGNGMSIALHTAHIASKHIREFLQNKISRDVMEKSYVAEWQHQFGNRLRRGRWLQYFFGSRILSNVFVKTFRTMPFLSAPVVKMTHGQPF